MQFRWVPSLQKNVQPRNALRKSSLVRTVLAALLLISLIPVLLIGTLNYLRTRDLLRSQIDRQLESIVLNEVRSLRDIVTINDRVVNQLVSDPFFNDNLYRLLNAQAGSFEQADAQTNLFRIFDENRGRVSQNQLERMMLFLSDGQVLITTDRQWVSGGLGKDRITDPYLLSLFGSNRSEFVYNKIYGYTNKVVLVTSRTFTGSQDQKATLVTVTSSDRIGQIVSEAGSFLQEANSYYFTPETTLIEHNQFDIMMDLVPNLDVQSNLKGLVGDTRVNYLFTATSYNDVPIIAYAAWVPEQKIGVVTMVAESSVYAVSNPFDRFNILALVLSLMISGVIVYLGSTRLVRPLVQLAQSADAFSKGNWDERTQINRSDEIGMLAGSFNRMAEELSRLYRSLESVVEQRTSQVRIASEVAQIATSSSSLEETLVQAVTLLAERFGFYNVAAYLTEQNAQALVLKEASGSASDELKRRGHRVPVNERSMIGWVASRNMPRMMNNVQEDSLYQPNELLPETSAEIGVPISIGSEVLGVLVVRSKQADAFDEEIVTVLMTLANQISSNLYSMRLLESAQVSYQETNLLYRATRQVTQAKGESEVQQILIDTFTLLPYVGAILSLEGDVFKIQLVTEPRSGRVEKGLLSQDMPAGRASALLAENRLAFLDDLTRLSDYSSMLSFLLRRGCKSAALLGIFESGRLTRVLVFGSREGTQFTQTALQPYSNLAEVVGASLEKFRVLSTLQQRLAELQILASVAQAVTAETNITELYQVLHQQVVQTLGPDLEFAVATFDESHRLIHLPYFYEKNHMVNLPPFELGTGLTSTLILERKPLLLPDEQAIRARSAILVGQPARSWMGVPLIFAGKVLGALIVQDLENENRFTEDDLNLFMALAPQVATAVRNAQLYTQAQEALKAYDQERFLLNNLLANMPEGITFKDLDGRYIRASRSVAQIFSLQPQELIGKTDFDLLDPATAEQSRQEEQAVMQQKAPQIGQVLHKVLQSGSEVWTHISRIPVWKSTGEPYGILVIERDITEMKQAEALAQRRAEQVFTAAEIARDTTGTLEVEVLLQKAVNLIRERFGFYHASIFLLDTQNEYAVLRESTGEAGQKMLQSGHRLAVGSKSIVGKTTASGSPVIVHDVTTDPTHLPNPLLPETRSEMAIPLKVGERVLGALDVQSTRANIFTTEDISVLEILADQLAVALVNGELFAKTQELLTKHRLLRQVSISAGVTTTLEDALVNVVSGLRAAQVGERIAILLPTSDGNLQVRASAGYEGTRHTEALIPISKGITGLTAFEKRPIRVDDTRSDPRYINLDPAVRSELAVPILFGEELIGVLNIESTRAFAFDENDQEIIGALGNNLGAVLANVRLIVQVRQQVVRERQLFEVTSKIRHSVDLETILQTSTQELARALGARRASIKITSSSDVAGVVDSEPPGNGHSNGKGKAE